MAKTPDMQIFNDLSADVTAEPDEGILEDFIACGCDLLAPFFPEQDLLRLRLRIVAEVTFADKQLWQEVGRSAFESLSNGLILAWGYPGARDWARLLEPLLRTLCDKAGLRLIGKEDLGALLGKTRTKLLQEDRPPYEAIPCLFGRARAETSTHRCTKQFACIAASDYRNKHGHERWPNTGWRERIEIAEAVLVTLIYMLEQHRDIERVVVMEQARKELKTYQAGRTGFGDFDWCWRFKDNAYTTSSDKLIGAVLDEFRCGARQLVVHGPRGVGLTYLGDRILGASKTSSEDPSNPLVFVRGSASPPKHSQNESADEARTQDADYAFMSSFLGDSWNKWWVEYALQREWLVVVLDSLEQLDDGELTRFVWRCEHALNRWPHLRLIIVRPDDLPATESGPRRDALGKLARGEELGIVCRLDGTKPKELPDRHPARLGYWLALGAQGLEQVMPEEAVWTLLNNGLDELHDRRWLDLQPPHLRPGARVLALEALYRFVEALDEEGDPTRIPRMRQDEFSRVLFKAYGDLLGWCGMDFFPAADSLPEGLGGFFDAVSRELRDVDYVREGEGDDLSGQVWLAHPMIEEHARPEDYRDWVRRKWEDLHSDYREAILALAQEQPLQTTASEE